MSDIQTDPPASPPAGGQAGDPDPAPQPTGSPRIPPAAGTVGGLSASHAMVGVSAAGATQALTTLLNGYQGFGFPQGLDLAHAGSAAFLIVSAGLAIYKGAAWLISWKWPSAPPLPTN